MKRLKENKYFHLGVMILSMITVSLVLLAIVLNLDAVGQIFDQIGDVFSPLIIGLILAYLLNPVMKRFDKWISWLLLKWKMKDDNAKKLSKILSLIITMLVFALALYGFCAMLLPQLYVSIRGIVSNFSTYYTNIELWLSAFLADNPTVQKYAMDLISSGYDMLKNWANSGLLPSLEAIVTGVTSSVVTVVGGAFDLVIGICAAVYMLASKDLFLAQSKKLVVALFRTEAADRILMLGRRINRVFSGFIIGQLAVSLLVGVVCYIGMLILRLPYPALISTVVAVTNVIPFFGPFIGAIPSAILILLVDPIQAVYFSLFILALQQLEGNVISPHILGDTIGISGFWVLVSTTVAGGLFGFGGMILGAPVFAVLYMLINDAVTSRLKKKNHPTETSAYHAIQNVEDLHQTQESNEDTPEA